MIQESHSHSHDSESESVRGAAEAGRLQAAAAVGQRQGRERAETPRSAALHSLAAQPQGSENQTQQEWSVQCVSESEWESERE